MAGVALIAAMYLADLLIGLHPLPQLLQQPLLAVMPGPVFGFLIDTLKHAGKVLEEASLIAVMLIALGGLGVLYAALAERRPVPYLSTLCAGLGWAVVTLVLLPVSGDGFLGLNEGIQAPLLWAVLFLVYSIALQTTYGAPAPAAANPDRRRVMRTLPLAIAGVSVLVLAGRLLPRWYKTVFQAPEAGTAGALPQVTPIEQFYVVSKNFQDPDVSTSGWVLKVHGEVGTPLALDYAALTALPARTQYVTLECISNTVGGPQISTGLFGGVSLRDLVEMAHPAAGATSINFTATDGFTETMPIGMARDHPEILVALQLDGHPLPSAHGFPARILIPGHYGMKGPKWLTDIEVSGTSRGGYWEGQGWDSMAVVKTMSRIDSPMDGQSVALKTTPVAGVAFAGLRGVSRVELTTDGGRTWMPAVLRPPLSPYSWVLWEVDWMPPAEGAYTLSVRAYDGNGAIQESATASSFPSGSTGLHSIAVNASKS